jgi:hypothetical protein
MAMTGNPDSQDRSFEAIDFIINVLKEHEKILDKSIETIASVLEQVGNTDELDSKLDNITEKLEILEKQIANLNGCFFTNPSKDEPIVAEKIDSEKKATYTMSSGIVQEGPSVILSCKQWTDFEALASQAQTLSFYHKEAEALFEVSALKGNRIITFAGTLPNLPLILKTWLSMRLDIDEQSILEGSFTLK